MLNCRLVYPRNKGFTLIELILWLALFSILATSFLSLLNYVNHLIYIGDKEDEVLLNGKYGFEFIKKEVSSADKIIPSYRIENLNFQYPSNIGFVILTISQEDRKDNYNYSTYYLREDELRRISTNQDSSKYPKSNDFSGYNQICTRVVDLSKTKLDTQKKIIDLKLYMGCKDIETKVFETRIFIRCPIDG